MKRRTIKALEDLDPPLKVTEECLYFRENRQGVEKVHDIVETTLLTEVKNLKNSQDRLKQCLEQVISKLKHCSQNVQLICSKNIEIIDQ